MVEVMGIAPMSCPSFDLYQRIMFYLYQITLQLSSLIFHDLQDVLLQSLL